MENTKTETENKTKKTILNIVSIGLGIAALAGCYYILTKNKPSEFTHHNINFKKLSKK
jgi:hypothetical protein